MDICTAIAITTMTLQACYTDNVCHPSTDGSKQICTGRQFISCGGLSPPAYECRRPDGSIYIFVDKTLSETPSLVIPKK